VDETGKGRSNTVNFVQRMYTIMKLSNSVVTQSEPENSCWCNLSSVVADVVSIFKMYEIHKRIFQRKQQVAGGNYPKRIPKT
jgi:hypothetical protein